MHPLYWCIINDNYEMAKQLINSGADTNIICSFGNLTNMLIAMQHGSIDMVKLLLNNGFNFEKLINCVDLEHSATPLYIACQNGLFDCIKCIFDHEKGILNSENMIIMDI